MEKTIRVNKEDLERLMGYAATAHELTEAVKLSPSEKQRRRLEYISDYADQIHHGIKNMLPKVIKK